MPLGIAIIIRIWRAFSATFRLLTDWQLLRTLPWPYIRRLPLHDVWIALIAVGLFGTLAMTIATAVAPAPSVRSTAFEIGLVAALGGLISSWVRAATQWLRTRR